jgi:hypothetical protein
MAANTLDPKSLARVAIWARLFCASTRTQKWASYDSWSGYDLQEWSRLLELASAVDRKTLLRLLGIFYVLMFCCCLVLAALLIAAIVHFKPPVPFSLSLVGLLIMVGIGGIGCSIAGVACSWVAVEGAVRHGLIESLTVQAGDAELVAKVRRQTFWVVGASVAAVVLILVTLMAFSETLDPILYQWNWLLQLFAVAFWIVFLVQIFRRPRVITRPGSAEHS